MKRILELSIFQLLSEYTQHKASVAELTERNMLQKAADEATLKNVLVMKQAWVPYPAYTDRAGN